MYGSADVLSGSAEEQNALVCCGPTIRRGKGERVFDIDTPLKARDVPLGKQILSASGIYDEQFGCVETGLLRRTPRSKGIVPRR